MNEKQKRALAKAKAIALEAKRKAAEANAKADPVIDGWVTRTSKRLTDSPYTGPIILGVIVCTAAVLIVVLL